MTKTDDTNEVCDMKLIPFSIALRNAQTASIREVGPSDRDLLTSGFEHLSDQSRYFRFLAAHSKLSGKELTNFTAMNDKNHVAIGAVVEAGSEVVPLGIARFIRLEKQHDVAEFAITIVDEYQGLGLGSLLLGVLAKWAVLDGVSNFTALVHPENDKMRGVLDRLGCEYDRLGDTEFEYRLPLFENADDYPASSTGDAFGTAYELAVFT